MTVVRAPAKSTRSATNFTLPFVNSVKNVFSKMVKVEITVDQPHEKTEAEPKRDVSAIIGLSGEVVGTVVVSFDSPVAEKLIASFAPFPIDPASPDFADALGELANMIAGGAKKEFGVEVFITVPSVVIGKGHHIALLKNAPCLVIPCRTPLGEFAVEVCIKQSCTV